MTSVPILVADRPEDASAPRTYQVRTFGCQMNVHDSERLAGALEAAGYVHVAHGETPDVVRNHPLLKDLNIPRTGQSDSVGTLVTKTLVIAGDPQFTTTADRPRGAMLRAYDKTNGKEVGAIWLPAPNTGSAMTYMLDGRQYIIVGVSGGNYSGEYIAFALPASATRPSTQQ